MSNISTRQASSETSPVERRFVKRRVSIFARMRGYFIAGILVTAPLAITLYLTWVIIFWIDNFVGGLLPEKYVPKIFHSYDVPGIGLILGIIVLTLVGAFTTNYFGRFFVHTGEAIVNRMPVIRSVYGALKQIFETVLAKQSTAFRQVVLVEYPRRGIWAIGFITSPTEGEVTNLCEDDLVNIFLPTTPNPTSGFLLFVPIKDVIVLKMTIDEAFRFVISGGIVTPPDRRPRRERETSFIPSRLGYDGCVIHQPPGD
ncbi:MAG: DUF502 domain-containing protein [Pseudomonadota bacterium]|nr:DUF502 domain-containing protein [Pseudomonadota bacterium]